MRGCINDDTEATGLEEEGTQNRALWSATIHTGDPTLMKIKPSITKKLALTVGSKTHLRTEAVLITQRAINLFGRL